MILEEALVTPLDVILPLVLPVKLEVSEHSQLKCLLKFNTGKAKIPGG